ncbi:SCO family protein [Halioxenophilus sp. WMMB6]|uniref:SCO family protein n=1 Tax=Halioxenophilus sp. WMMB6 TaxID=3073815 RepID=UPI00295E38DE|nr:SCO family protein [Halioxenophilus sp. WMMB6]
MTAVVETSPLPTRTRRGVWLSVASSVLFMAMVLLLFLNRFLLPTHLTAEQLSNDAVRVLQEPRPLVLGNLQNQLGEPVTPAFFQGHWSLLFFGFTHCPDICPTTLYELNRAIKQLPPQLAAKVQVTLVSVDPARDTSQVIADYVQQFNDGFTGITGEFVDLKLFANSVSVPFVKVPVTGPHAQHMGANAYQIDHGAQLVVVNPDGNYHAFFKAPIEGDVVAKQLPAIVNAY